MFMFMFILMKICSFFYDGFTEGSPIPLALAGMIALLPLVLSWWFLKRLLNSFFASLSTERAKAFHTRRVPLGDSPRCLLSVIHVAGLCPGAAHPRPTNNSSWV